MRANVCAHTDSLEQCIHIQTDLITFSVDSELFYAKLFHFNMFYS